MTPLPLHEPSSEGGAADAAVTNAPNAAAEKIESKNAGRCMASPLVYVPES
jgi:hypothetical protein